MENEFLNELVENSEDSTITAVPSDVEHTQIFLVLPSQAPADPVEDDQVKTENIVKSEETMELRSVNVSNETITAADTNGIKASLLQFIGDYTTIVTDYTYSNGSYSSHSVDVQPDYIWIASFLFFTLVMCSLIKFLGICTRGYTKRRR